MKDNEAHDNPSHLWPALRKRAWAKIYEARQTGKAPKFAISMQELADEFGFHPPFQALLERWCAEDQEGLSIGSSSNDDFIVFIGRKPEP